MINKNIKLLISFIFLLSNNLNFRGMEKFEKIELIPKSFSANNFNSYFKPKSILKQKGERNLNSNKKVTFADIVKILSGDEIIDENLKELEKSRRKTFEKEKYSKLTETNNI